MRTLLADEARRLEDSVDECRPVVGDVSPAPVAADDVVLHVRVDVTLTLGPDVGSSANQFITIPEMHHNNLHLSCHVFFAT